jgi:hypothetical protein
MVELRYKTTWHQGGRLCCMFWCWHVVCCGACRSLTVLLLSLHRRRKPTKKLLRQRNKKRTLGVRTKGWGVAVERGALSNPNPRNIRGSAAFSIFLDCHWRTEKSVFRRDCAKRKRERKSNNPFASLQIILLHCNPIDLQFCTN